MRFSNETFLGIWAGFRETAGAEFELVCCRRRGTGGGSSGRTSNRAVNSASDGIGVVRALHAEQGQYNEVSTTKPKTGILLDDCDSEIW